MRTLYEAANGIEAHLLRDALRHEGFSPRVDGAYLQGALGELPAGGMVRLVIPEEEYAEARAFVLNWEKQQPVSGEAAGTEDEGENGSTGDGQATNAPTTGIAKSEKGKTAIWLLIGLALGMGASALYFRAPATSEGIDHNNDGVLDETWTYSASGEMQTGKVDRNLDGKVDAILAYDRTGWASSVSSDDDFDGFFETGSLYENGNAKVERIDSDADGIADVVWTYRHGVIVRSEHINPLTNLPLRVGYWKLGTLRRADIDSDRDGVLETRITYSPLEEELKREPIP